MPLPTVTFTDDYNLTIHGETIMQLKYVDNDHEPGNIYIWVPQSKVLMKVDVVFPSTTVFKNLALTSSYLNFLRAHDVLLSYPFVKLVTGHWGIVGTPSDVRKQKRYILDMQSNAVVGLTTVSFSQAVADSGYANVTSPNFNNQPYLLNLYLNRVVDVCTRLTLASWTEQRLVGVNVFTDGHCFTIIESLRID